MPSILEEKLAICYVCSGPTYRKTALRKLNEFWIDDDNIYYFVLTDDKKYFKDVKRKNLLVNELKDFHGLFPEVEKYERFIESSSEEDYARQFVGDPLLPKPQYYFPFSVYRFPLYQAYKHGITNVALLCTDTDLILEEVVKKEVLRQKNTVRTATTWWPETRDKPYTSFVLEVLKEKFNIRPELEFMVYDGAGRLLSFSSVDQMGMFFKVWNDVILTLYARDLMRHFIGWWAHHDESILGPIYNSMGMLPSSTHINSLFSVNHNPKEERFWLY